MAKLFNWKAFKRFLRVNKEGALIGGIVGTVVAFYIKSKGVNLMAFTVQKGLIDIVMSRSAPADIGFAKLWLTCAAIFALVGLIIDALYKPRK